MMEKSASNSEERTYLNALLSAGKNESIEYRSEEVNLPTWYNADLFKKAQKHFNRNIFAIFYGTLYSLIMALVNPSIRRVLLATSKSSSPQWAYQRYMKIFFYIRKWNCVDFEKNPQVLESIGKINKIHRMASKTSESLNCGKINQMDMALMQFAFMGPITLKANLLGITASNEDLEATLHFWRTIGYLMGISDSYNLCTDSWATTKPRLEILLQEFYQPLLQSLDDEFMELVRDIVSGLKCFNPFLSVDAVLYFTKRLAGCPGYEYLKTDYPNPELQEQSQKLYKEFNVYNRFLLSSMVCFHQQLHKSTICRLNMNARFKVDMFLLYYFPVVALMRFGVKDSYIRTED